jgi:asparagine synthetase B (glutamine-hydrolysing)
MPFYRYAFVFYQHTTRTVYFGRDPLGRRSLLIRKPSGSDHSITIASVSFGNPNFEELPANSLFSISWREAVRNQISYSIPSNLTPELN